MDRCEEIGIVRQEAGVAIWHVLVAETEEHIQALLCPVRLAAIDEFKGLSSGIPKLSKIDYFLRKPWETPVFGNAIFRKLGDIW